MNAALRSQHKDSWSPSRENSYMGVMIDDLITKGVTEPYRMFTSRAEYRLLLREDNADLRLTSKARSFGLICENHWVNFNQKQEAIHKEESRLKKLTVSLENTNTKDQRELFGKQLEQDYKAFDLLKRPEVSYNKLMTILNDAGANNVLVREQVEILAKYSGYIIRQKEQIERNKKQMHKKIPKNIDYDDMHGLSIEAKQLLNENKPENLSQASRISGITPSTISIIMVYLKKNKIGLNKEKTSKVA
jgi:tRNA uridine 5-carboxymethylaminomethyl modification enzyme